MLHHCIISSKSWRLSVGAGIAADSAPLNLPRIPNEADAAVGDPSTESVWWPLSEEARNECRVGVDSSFAHSKELEEPYSHSAWRFAQLAQVGRASSH